MCGVLLRLPTSAQTYSPESLLYYYFYTHACACSQSFAITRLPSGSHTHTHTPFAITCIHGPSPLYTTNNIYQVYCNSNITGGASIKTNKLHPHAALSVSPSFLLSMPLTGAPTISLYPSLYPLLQPQMVKHCDQLKTSPGIEPVIVPAI